MFSHSHKISIGLMLILAAFLAYIVLQMPLWLDERYSLFFAVSQSIEDLIIQSKDTHPGLYYAFLKVALTISTNITVLRLLLGVLPQWLGVAILLKYLADQGKSHKRLAFTGGLLLLNPFLAFTASQLRMYGLVIFFSCLTYVFLSKWLKVPSHKNWMLLVATLFLGNAADYSFFFLSLGVIALTAWTVRKDRKVAAVFTIASSILFFAEFLILAGFSVKRQFEAASWIPSPDFINVPSLFLTISGIESNFFLASSSLHITTVLFYLLIVMLIIKLFRDYSGKKKKLQPDNEVVFLVVLPILAIFSVSILFPILSQRFFFYQFLPKLSIFLPRAFLPEVVMASVLAARYLAKNRPDPLSRLLRTGVIAVVCVGWMFNALSIQRLTENFSQVESAKEALLSDAAKLETRNGKQTEIVPSWIWLNQLNEQTLSAHKEIETRVLSSEKTEEVLFQRTATVCQGVGDKNIYLMRSEGFYTIQSYYQVAEENLDVCCERVTSENEFKVWTCD